MKYTYVLQGIVILMAASATLFIVYVLDSAQVKTSKVSDIFKV